MMIFTFIIVYFGRYKPQLECLWKFQEQVGAKINNLELPSAKLAPLELGAGEQMTL